MNLTLLLISSGIIVIYLAYIFIRYGIQPSISNSYYALGNKEKPLFTLALWGFAIPIIIVANTPIMFIGASFICVVGATQNFKIKSEGLVHSISAVIGIGLGIASLFFEFKTPLTAIAIILSGIALYVFNAKNKVLWVEIIALSMISLSLYLTQI